jgi:anti-sigma28 factor (negative regulator of flagellin synthesis)
MQINSGSPTNVHPASTPGISHSTGLGTRSDSSTEESSDGVQLSHLSSVLNGLAAGAAAGAKRVSSLSALIKAGAYQVRPVQVSQRMIDDALSSN